MRIILLVHRYLGVAIGLVMTLWCLSGFVMMYRGYPQVTAMQRLQALRPLDLAGARAAPDLGTAPIEGFRIEMLAGRPVLRLASGGPRILDLRTGGSVPATGSADAAATATEFAGSQGVATAETATQLIDEDQWTVEGASRRGPVYRVAFAGPTGTVVYVAERTGAVVQATDRDSRLWAWLGAVPHWLYPTVLRRHGPLWQGVVVWTALIGVFLTVTGLYVGISKLRRTRRGLWSPYRGWWWWHHMAGLVFGLFTLTWVASGLLSMNPAGLLESAASETDQAAIAGQIAPADLRGFLATYRAVPGAAILDSAPLGGRLFVIEQFKDGRRLRLDDQGRPALLGRGELQAALAAAGKRPSELRLMTRPDLYYYPGYDQPAPLPVWIARGAGPGARVDYLDPVSGEVRLALDANARASRWLRTGLHDLDFPGLRARPVWDLVTLALLAGVLASTGSGAWLGLKRLVRDLSRLRKRRA